jgi:hypothetical protein
MLAQAWLNNALHRLTGMLDFDGKQVLQVIAGAPRALFDPYGPLLAARDGHDAHPGAVAPHGLPAR